MLSVCNFSIDIDGGIIVVSTCPGPGAYKIPSFNDVPAHLSVCLLRGASNPRAVYSSKAVGEPPLFLAASVFYAIKVSFDWSVVM